MAKTSPLVRTLNRIDALVAGFRQLQLPNCPGHEVIRTFLAGLLGKSGEAVDQRVEWANALIDQCVLEVCKRADNPRQGAGGAAVLNELGVVLVELVRTADEQRPAVSFDPSPRLAALLDDYATRLRRSLRTLIVARGGKIFPAVGSRDKFLRAGNANTITADGLAGWLDRWVEPFRMSQMAEDVAKDTSSRLSQTALDRKVKKCLDRLLGFDCSGEDGPWETDQKGVRERIQGVTKSGVQKLAGRGSSGVHRSKWWVWFEYHRQHLRLVRQRKGTEPRLRLLWPDHTQSKCHACYNVHKAIQKLDARQSAP